MLLVQDIYDIVVGVLQSAMSSIREQNLPDAERHVTHALQVLAERPARGKGRSRARGRGRAGVGMML